MGRIFEDGSCWRACCSIDPFSYKSGGKIESTRRRPNALKGLIADAITRKGFVDCLRGRIESTNRGESCPRLRLPSRSACPRVAFQNRSGRTFLISNRAGRREWAYCSVLASPSSPCLSYAHSPCTSIMQAATQQRPRRNPINKENNLNLISSCLLTFNPSNSYETTLGDGPFSFASSGNSISCAESAQLNANRFLGEWQLAELRPSSICVTLRAIGNFIRQTRFLASPRTMCNLIICRMTF